MKAKYFVLLIAIALSVLIAVKLNANKNKINSRNAPARVLPLPIPVAVARAEERMVKTSFFKTGNVAPFKEAKAIAILSGKITDVYFSAGDAVQEGQVLARMEPRAIELDLEKAENSVFKAKHDLDVYSELFAGKACTEEKLNEVRSVYFNAVNESDKIRRSKNDLVVRAPTAGIISVKSVEKGVFVGTGAEIATIVNLSKPKIDVSLSESEVYQVRRNQDVGLQVDVIPDKVFSGTISFISPQGDAYHNYKVEIMMKPDPAAALRSGTFVYVDFGKGGSRKLLMIPRSAFGESLKNQTVYVVDKDTLQRKLVRTGIEEADNVEVKSGLKPGDLVVVSGQINLETGSRVSISK